MLPPGLVTAAASSLAAGKNPWLPIGVLLVLGAPDGLPPAIIDPVLQRGLHTLGPAWMLYGLGAVFLLLALAESLADKLEWIEAWLTPISTLWRPIAGVAASALVAFAVAQVDETDAPEAAAAAALQWQAGGAVVVTIVVGAIFGLLAAIGKTGTRLLLMLVAIPSVRTAHSFVDDVIVVGATVVGLVWHDHTLVIALGVVYLVVGLALSPILLRLTRIHLAIGRAALAKALRRARRAAPPPLPSPPRWLVRALGERQADAANASTLPAYVWRAPVVGWCRQGWLVLSLDGAWFATHTLFGTRLLRVPRERAARVGLSENATGRDVVIVEETPGGALREIVVHLFPGEAEPIHAALDRGARAAALAQARPDSESARRALPGGTLKGRSERYAAEAGSLRTQGLVTVLGAATVGVLTAGAFIPVGLGYLFSPFKRRALFGLALSVYLALCVVATLGLALPGAILYGVCLNLVALRDLSRQALKHAVDGFVDRDAFLPPVCGRVWLPSARLARADAWRESDSRPATDAGWRAALAILRSAPTAPAA